MAKTLRWLALLTVIGLTAAPVWAGVAVVGSPSGGFAGGLYATDGGGNPVDTAPAAPDELSSVSESDVTGAPPGGTGSHFTFGPDANFERGEGAGAAIHYFDDLPLKPISNLGNAGAALAAGPKGGLAATPQFSSGGGGGGLLLTHVLPEGTSSIKTPSNAWGGQSFVQGGGNSSPNTAANHSIQLASFQLAVDRLSSGPGPMVTVNSLAANSLTDRMISTPAGGETSGFFTSGTWGTVQNVSTALPSPATDHAAFSVSGMAPEPGSLVVWALLGLVFGGAGWRHRRRLLALA